MSNIISRHNFLCFYFIFFLVLSRAELINSHGHIIIQMRPGLGMYVFINIMYITNYSVAGLMMIFYDIR